jgi:hypothetical protein
MNESKRKYKSYWDMVEALKTKRVRTRDGRDVFNFKKAIMNGETVLIGDVAIKKPPYPNNTIINYESHYWSGGGLGHHGGDDLVLISDYKSGISHKI